MRTGKKPPEACLVFPLPWPESTREGRQVCPEDGAAFFAEKKLLFFSFLSECSE